MKFASASKVNRKSGVRSGERWAPVRYPLVPLGLWGCSYSQQGLDYADGGAD
jgi:hypothetical protein